MFKFSVLAFLFLIWMANCDNFSFSSTQLREISSVVNNVGQLPCPIGSLDDVAMILWFKDSSGAPIYSYDARGKENEKEEPARHLTMKNDWGLRLYFRVWRKLRRPPALIIQNLKPSDAGVYRCRVDYRSSPTTNYVMRLVVVEPPTHLEIRDTSARDSAARPISDQQMVPSSQHSDITYLGPYQEGQNVTITCTAFGGKPNLADVRWMKNGELVMNYNSSYKVFGSSNYATNELQIVNLGAEHASNLYTCSASNNNESKAILHSVNLDVYLGVKNVDLEIPDEMTAGEEYTLICKATGAYPSVKIEIWKLQKRLGPKYQTRSDADNVTVYNFPYKPEILDDEGTISCKAENPWLNEKPVVARKTLKIKYTPVAIIRFGQNKTTNFSEGESVLIECHIRANPQIYSILWFHQEKQLFNNETAGIRITGMTLILTNLKPNYGGKYFCEGENAVGKGISNPLLIELTISPKCANSEATRIPLEVGETHQLGCYVLAWPPDLNFYWTLNRSHDIVPILPVAVNKNPGTNGTFEGIPLEDFDEYIFPTMRRGDYEAPLTVEGSGSEIDVHQGPQGLDPHSSLTDAEKNGTLAEGASTPLLAYKKSVGSGIKSNSTGRKYTKSKSGDKKDIWREETDGQSRSSHSVQSAYGGGRWKPPQDNPPDNIHHQAILSYTIKSIEDYGTVACWARNSYGETSCIFHIISKEEANQDEALGDVVGGGITRYGNLTGVKFASKEKDIRAEEREEESGIQGSPSTSKLQTTLGIILMVLLIFIASLGGLLVFLLVILAKRRRQIQRIIMTNRKKKRRKQEQRETAAQVASSTIEKCTSSISFTSGSCSYGAMEPFSIETEDSGAFCTTTYSESEPTSCISTTTFTTISNQNDFPPPATSIISTASTSHGYGSIEEDEMEDE